MTPTPVGMRCPECGRQRTKVQRPRAVAGAVPTVTRALVAINVAVFLAQVVTGTSLFGGAAGGVFERGALYGPAVAFGHDYWRLVTSGFLHAGLIHIGFNMWLLWIVGQMLEPAFGAARFALVYVTALLCGSFGVLLIDPNAVTVGASGAVFGVMGAGVIAMRHRGIDPMQSGLLPTIVLNLVITFAIPGISIGGHIGGLIGGAVAGWILDRPVPRGVAAYGPVAATVALAVLAAGGAIAVA